MRKLIPEAVAIFTVLNVYHMLYHMSVGEARNLGVLHPMRRFRQLNRSRKNQRRKLRKVCSHYVHCCQVVDLYIADEEQKDPSSLYTTVNKKTKQGISLYALKISYGAFLYYVT